MEIIFLTYINRSGSTYLAQILSASDDLLVCPEAEILVQEFLEDPGKNFSLSELYAKKLIQYLENDRKLKHWGLTDEDVGSLSSVKDNFEAFKQLLRNYRDKTKPDATKIMFKAERIVYLWDKINMAKYPDDKIQLISVIRDPRAIYASQKKTLWPGTDQPFSQNSVHTALSWCRYIRKVLRLSALYKNTIHIRFEDLLKEPVKSLNTLMNKLQLSKIDFQPEEGDLYNRIPADQKIIHGNIQLQPVVEKENEWKQKLTGLEIDLIQTTARKELHGAGYKTQQRKSGLIKIFSIRILQVVFYYFNLYSSRAFFKLKKMIYG